MITCTVLDFCACFIQCEDTFCVFRVNLRIALRFPESQDFHRVSPWQNRIKTSPKKSTGVKICISWAFDSNVAAVISISNLCSAHLHTFDHRSPRTANCSSRSAVALSLLPSSTTTTICVREFTCCCCFSRSSWKNCAMTRNDNTSVTSLGSNFKRTGEG